MAVDIEYRDMARLYAKEAAENERLRAALKPFADALTRAEKDEPESPDNRLECCRTDLTLYEFSQARSALEQSEPEKKQ